MRLFESAKLYYLWNLSRGFSQYSCGLVSVMFFHNNVKTPCVTFRHPVLIQSLRFI